MCRIVYIVVVMEERDVSTTSNISALFLKVTEQAQLTVPSFAAHNYGFEAVRRDSGEFMWATLNWSDTSKGIKRCQVISKIPQRPRQILQCLKVRHPQRATISLINPWSQLQCHSDAMIVTLRLRRPN